MPDDDHIDPIEGFEPDDYDDDVNPYEEAQRWANGQDIYLPNDFFGELSSVANPENVRGIPFANITDAIEYLYGTGAFPYARVLVDDEEEFFFVEVDYPETS